MRPNILGLACDQNSFPIKFKSWLVFDYFHALLTKLWLDTLFYTIFYFITIKIDIKSAQNICTNTKQMIYGDNQFMTKHIFNTQSFKIFVLIYLPTHAYAPVPLCQIYSRMRTNWQFGWSFLVIPGHSSLCTQQCQARILFIRGYAHIKHVVIFFVAQLTCCILVILTVFVVVLTVIKSFVLIVRLGQTRRQCELRRMELQSRYSC